MGSFTGRTLFGYFFYSLEKVSEPKAKIQRIFEKDLNKKIGNYINAPNPPIKTLKNSHL
jgi:hypothetical protein